MLTEILAPSLIAEGSRLHGTLTFLSSTQVFGSVEGEVCQESLDSLQVGKTGWVQGRISARGPVIIEGRVDGDVYSECLIRLLPTATVKGSLTAPAIDIRAGALLDGALQMKAAAK